MKPNRPFSLRKGEFGPGAREILGRHDYMDIGSSVYGHGPASTVGNANRLWMTDTGVTRHMNQYMKMVFDWNHVEFNNPVVYNTVSKKKITTDNTLWRRIQLYF